MTEDILRLFKPQLHTLEIDKIVYFHHLQYNYVHACLGINFIDSFYFNGYIFICKLNQH